MKKKIGVDEMNPHNFKIINNEIYQFVGLDYVWNIRKAKTEKVTLWKNLETDEVIKDRTIRCLIRKEAPNDY